MPIRGCHAAAVEWCPDLYFESSPFAFLLWRSLRVFCLSVSGFVKPPICKALVAGHAKQVFGAFCI